MAAASTREKVFGIGFPRTGTTTLGKCFEILGYRYLGFDYPALTALVGGDLDAALEKTALVDALEDAPWFMVYEELAERYPNARFILTVRDSVAKWARSAGSHGARVAQTAEGQHIIGLFSEFYAKRGVEHTNIEEVYLWHNRKVTEFFAAAGRPLLTVCWEQGDGWPELCEFLGEPIPRDRPFPHENASDFGSP